MTTKTVAEETKAQKPKLGSKPNTQDDLTRCPMPQVEKKLESSPEGLTQAEAKKRLTQYGPNEIEEKENQSAPEIPLLFLGSDPVDD